MTATATWTWSATPLDVHQRALEFLPLAYEIVDRLPRGNASRYKISRGEAMECAASQSVKDVSSGIPFLVFDYVHVAVAVNVDDDGTADENDHQSLEFGFARRPLRRAEPWGVRL